MASLPGSIISFWFNLKFSFSINNLNKTVEFFCIKVNANQRFCQKQNPVGSSGQKPGFYSKKSMAQVLLPWESDSRSTFWFSQSRVNIPKALKDAGISNAWRVSQCCFVWLMPSFSCAWLDNVQPSAGCIYLCCWKYWPMKPDKLE